MAIISREILNHPDFGEDFEGSMIAYLESVMDEEFAKDEADFDLIDTCAEAINAIRSGETAELFSLISYDRLIKKTGRNKNRSKIIAVAAICAVIAIAGFSGTVIHTDKDTTAVQYIARKLNEIFEKDLSDDVEYITGKSTETEMTDTVSVPQVADIIVKTGKEFKEEYEVGEKFSEQGISVTAKYTDGTEKPAEYVLSVPDDFGNGAGYETVTVISCGFKKELTVRVIENERTVKLNSIYASFPDSFDFRVSDIDNIDLSEMEVYAVFSDGAEEKLNSGQYKTEIEKIQSADGEKALITLYFENTSCSFIISHAKEKS